MKNTYLFLLVLSIFLLVSLQFAQGETGNVAAGFNVRTLSVEGIETFRLTLIIFSGSSSVYAGEFNVSYPSEYVNLTTLESGSAWVITPIGGKHVFYRNPSATTIGDRTELAVLTFKRATSLEPVRFNVSLNWFKAADGEGNDLTVQLVNSTVTVAFSAPSETPSGGGGIKPPATQGPPLSWILVIAIAISAVIMLSALYLRMRTMPLYFLTGTGFSIPVSAQDKVFGREDFVKILSSNKLNYISRKAKGGQFRITRFRDGFYIIDSYSTNGTLVDGVDIRGKGYVKLRNGARISVPEVLDMQFVFSK